MWSAWTHSVGSEESGQGGQNWPPTGPARGLVIHSSLPEASSFPGSLNRQSELVSGDDFFSHFPSAGLKPMLIFSPKRASPKDWDTGPVRAVPGIRDAPGWALHSPSPTSGAPGQEGAGRVPGRPSQPPPPAHGPARFRGAGGAAISLGAHGVRPGRGGEEARPGAREGNKEEPASRPDPGCLSL
ncbi:translation initiation factor IF-2-like [Ursus americanus]|uniref:translation initiation factor IF-2-like n=1 Tax=Ursus americanus TaxID=9643 RepID=UPI000E6DC441|nr:translation initiation factor IF-2-like [Ursus americanus]XP_045667745.1 translation initiation factor IF-2-like [Ursus americanus]